MHCGCRQDCREEPCEACGAGQERDPAKQGTARDRLQVHVRLCIRDQDARMQIRYDACNLISSASHRHQIQ
jgi:hypothetical protein